AKMTEVWKSQGRKFCEICKVWFGDNRASIEFHERGQKHQAAVKEKLRNLGKNNEKKAREAADLAATLAMMESGAAASMAAHNEGIVNGPALPERGLGIGPKVPVGGTKYLDPRQMSMQSMAEEMARRKREDEEKKAQLALTMKSSLWREDDPEDQQPLPKDDVSSIMWVETDSEDGRKYYYHMFSGATSWEVPDRFFTQKEYDRRLAEIEQRAIERAKKGLPTDPSQMTMMNHRGEEISTAPEIQVAKRKKARDQEEIEAELAKSRLTAEYGSTETPGGYGSASLAPPPADYGAPAPSYSMMPTSGGEEPAEKKTRFTSMPERSGPSVFATRKERRKEKGDSMPKEEDGGGLGGGGGGGGIPMPMDIPMPPQPPTGGGFTSSSGQYRTGPAIMSPTGGGERGRGGGGGYKRGGRSLVPAPFKKQKEKEFKAEEEEPEEEENVASEVMKMAATAAPFGGWTKVTKEEGISVPYVKPVSEEQTKADERAKAWRQREEEEKDIKSSAPKKVIPKIEFTEKVAPVLTKKKNTGPVEFKKKSAPKSVRRREEE
ncbi:hypothetical protein PENTCL1PPCAC_27040, partial [Pristionchus entomophagus]